MRSSKREHILESALRVVEDEGVAAVTFESVSVSSGLTKGGLLYHFPTKDALLLALHEHLAQKWEIELRDALGGDPDEASDEAKVEAYARVSVRSATGPELLLMLEARSDPALSAPWDDVMARWTPDPTQLREDDEDALVRLVTVIAADGLWLADSLGARKIPENVRRAVAERIVSAMRGSAGQSQAHAEARRADDSAPEKGAE